MLYSEGRKVLIGMLLEFYSIEKTDKVYTLEQLQTLSAVELIMEVGRCYINI